ncbi:hypothetical protein AB0I66_41645 [Streptomyces sp. NPDC050439]|uniref:hypothetical protein n=1 Tax=unclassified Streptomyces TaxID=2593676 RepID=UPI0034368834
MLQELIGAEAAEAVGAEAAVLPPQRGQFLALTAVSPLRSPASTPACFAQSRTAVSVSSKSLAIWPNERSPPPA